MRHVTKSLLQEYKRFLLTQGELFAPEHPDGEKKYIDISSERYGLHLSIIEELINTKKNVALDVLDIGCWPGHLAMILRKYHKAMVSGVGLTTHDLFRERLKKHDIHFTRSDIEKEALGYPDKSFDLILFTEIIEHLFNPFVNRKGDWTVIAGRQHTDTEYAQLGIVA
ncbi:MAG: class I SAM-dependent methyltransferase [Candidatus Edwardsbacteria bacterium]|nr:class I SAM-dependent methyltransferase [Candidatus Edwardsbacteria bacterium]